LAVKGIQKDDRSSMTGREVMGFLLEWSPKDFLRGVAKL
jgi:hypothetical protein